MIHLTNEQARVPIPAAKIRRLAVQILGKRNLSIAFVSNAAIRKINRKFLRHDFATDVISFPLGTDLVGELVISADYAAAEARTRKIPVEEELLRYVVHGILHLLGYDDHRPSDRAKMWKRQERELARVLPERKKETTKAPRHQGKAPLARSGPRSPSANVRRR